MIRDTLGTPSNLQAFDLPAVGTDHLIFFPLCSVDGFYPLSVTEAKAWACAGRYLKPTNNKTSANTVSCYFPYILFLLAFHMDASNLVQRHWGVGMSVFFFVSAFGDLSLKGFSRGGRECAWVMVSPINKDSVWIMHFLEHSPSGSSRTWVVDDWQRRPWTVTLWDLFIYLAV